VSDANSRAKWEDGSTAGTALLRQRKRDGGAVLGRVVHLGSMQYAWYAVPVIGAALWRYSGAASSWYAAQRAVRRALRETADSSLSGGTMTQPEIEPYEDEPCIGPICPICGLEEEWEDCEVCNGNSEYECYDEDPLWYDPGDTEPCPECGGGGGWSLCPNAPHGATT
jgi:hypothetical protein